MIRLLLFTCEQFFSDVCHVTQRVEALLCTMSGMSVVWSLYGDASFDWLYGSLPCYCSNNREQ